MRKPIKFQIIPFRIYLFILFSFLFLYPVFAQHQKANKRAEQLIKNAIILGDSARYDSAIVLLTEASKIYQRKKNTEKYIFCENEIIKQARYINFTDELLNKAKENLVLATHELGSNHSITGSSCSILGNIYADINKIDSALFYFKRAKQIWLNNPHANRMNIASANLNIGQMLSDEGQFNEAAALINLALWTKQDSLGDNHPDIAAVFNALGVLYYYKGDIDSCAFCFIKVLEIRKKCLGQTHPQVANAYNNAGVAYKVKGDLGKALELYYKALEIRKLIHDKPHPNLALSYSNIGVIYSETGDYKLANEYYQKALKIRLELFGENHLDVAASYTNIGINCMDLGEGGSAIYYTQKAFKIIIDTYGPDNPNSSDAYNNMGAAYVYGLGDLDKAMIYFKKGLELRLRTNPNNPLLIGSYNNIGAVCRNKGDYALALSYYNLGLEITKKHYPEKNVEFATAYNNMGEAYYHMNNYKLALEYYEKSKKIRQELFGPKYPGLSEVYLNIGVVYGKLGKLHEGNECFKKGLAICIENFDDNNISAAGFYNKMALNQAEMENYDTAVSLLQKALTIQKTKYKDDHPDISNSLYELGVIYSKSLDYNTSINYYLRALNADYLGEMAGKIDYKYVIDEILFLKILKNIASLYFLKYEKTNEINLLSKSIEYYKKASEMVAYLESMYTLETSKLVLLKNSAEVIEKAIQTTEKMYQKQESRATFALALSFSEQNKATILYQSIVTSQADFENTVDSNWVRQKDIIGKINYLKTSFLKQGNDADSIYSKQDISTEISRLLVEYQRIEDVSRANYKAKKIPYSSEIDLLDQLQSKLKSNEVLIEYSFAGNDIYCFIVANDFVQFETINIGDDFTDRIIDYVAGIKKHRIAEFQGNSNYLYKMLIKPVEKYLSNKNRLIIIPDGALLYLPFGSLVSTMQNFKGETDFSKLNYLINKYEIVYQYSANLWIQNFKNNNNDNTTMGFLGIAPFATNEISHEKPDSLNSAFLDNTLPEDILRSVANNDNEFNPLPFSGIEIGTIAKLFNNQSITNEALVGADATEKNLKKCSKDFKFIHIATHGIINNIHPELSGLAFCADKNPDTTFAQNNDETWKIEQSTDGILYAKEIYNLDLNAELVVLSACETGIGKLEKGEGMMSLTRGFLYNNVPNIVFSFWKINDKTTCELMTSFYKNVLDGKTYPGALRLAKLNMIANSATAFPSYWAGFSLIGN